MPTYLGFSQRFREALEEYGLKTTQRAVGNFFKVSEITARGWLTGEKMPGMANLRIIAEKLDVCIEWLSSGRGPRRPGKTQVGPGRPPILSEREKVLIRRYRRLAREDQGCLDGILEVLLKQKRD